MIAGLHNKWRAFLVASVLAATLLASTMAGCSETTSPASVGTSTVLTIVKGTQTSTYTMSSLKAIAATAGWAGQMSSTGTITGPNEYKGVAMTELLKAVGGITENDAVRVSAKDGYAMTLSYNQVTQGSGFPILDSTTGKEVTSTNKAVVFVAFEQDGKPLDDTVGPLRLGIMTSKTQVTDGHWWVKWTQKIEIVPTVKAWSLQLEGAINESIDQATFESCSAIGCHGVKWMDDQNRVWEGVPLWYLAGRVDDATDTHKGDAFSDAAADKGYAVHVRAADGTVQEFTAAQVKRNNALIIAYKRDGSPLPENQWPLRLVGSTLQKSQMVGQVTKIKLESSAGGPAATTAPTATPTTPSSSTTPVAAAGPTVLTVVNGTKTVEYSLAALQKFQPYSGNGGTKNKTGVITGPFTYQGVPLLVVVNAVGGASGALTADQSIKVTASDGFNKTLTYDQIVNGTVTTYDTTGAAATPTSKPVIALVYSVGGVPLDGATGPVQLGVLCADKLVSDGSAWVKMVVKIEVITNK
jgi:hypothetical protein